MHDKEKEYTWSKHNPFIARRLDFCFANENTLQLCVSCNILSVANTDYRAIVLEMNKSDFVRGPGYWRFNNSYLQDATFIDKMNELLDNLLIEKEEIQGNAQNYWELCKIKIKDLCIEYGKFQARNRRNELLDIQTKLQTLEKQCTQDPTNKSVKTQIQKVKLVS